MARLSPLARDVDEAFRTLPARYLGAPPGFDATWHVKLGDVGRVYEVRCTEHGARVRPGPSMRPDVVIGTDAATWLALREGTTNGIEAFSERRLYARGELDLAVGFEGLFRMPDGRDPVLRVRRVPVGAGHISTLTAGHEGPDVVLIHGLGSAKSSFLQTAAALHRAGLRVHAIDLPGFGGSAKPHLAPYTARWFASNVLELLDALDIDRAHLVGNSMGGRVSIEVALRAPERVAGLALLAPAVAFVRRGLHPVVRLLRPELGLVPHRFARRTVESQLRGLFADPDALDPAVADVVVDEFQRTYASAAARFAFLASARQIYLDAPFGRDGFYPRLAGLEPPALFVWGTHDELIPARLGEHVRRWLPHAEQLVLDACGHVPQVERPAQVAGVLRRFLASAAALGDAGRRLRAA